MIAAKILDSIKQTLILIISDNIAINIIYDVGVYVTEVSFGLITLIYIVITRSRTEGYGSVVPVEFYVTNCVMQNFNHGII